MNFRVARIPSRRAALVAAFFLALTLAAQGVPLVASGRVPISVDPALRELGESVASIIVQKWNSADRTAEDTIERWGGTVDQDLPIIGGFSATIPSAVAGRLGELTGARVVTLNGRVAFEGSGESSTIKSVYRKVVKASDMAAVGYSGQGVTVALIDTGVSAVPDLSGRVLPIYDDILRTYSPCVNLSGESHCNDSYGHGTFLAGIIASSGASSQGAYAGAASGANLVSVKIAGRSGAADVSTLLAAMQWVVSFKDRYGIKVLNLALGTNGRQSYRTDPLNYAVERVWAAGIVVVVSAGNSGPSASTISKPADDPWVITVGAIDDRGTNGLGDDTIPNFSSRGPTAADGLPKPDITAPGAHIVSLRAPGSEVDNRFPTYLDSYHRRGSGTSMAAAVVSGSVALMLQAKPQMTPDEVKHAVMATARSSGSDDPALVGAGVLNIESATFQAPYGLANQGLDHSTGTGSLDASRGDVRVQSNDLLGTVVSGQMTLQLLLWDPAGYLTGDWTGGTWYGGTWYGGTWYGGTWYGGTWYGGTWYGGTWYGGTWYGGTWYGQPEGGTWYGGTWYGGTWYGAWE